MQHQQTVPVDFYQYMREINKENNVVMPLSDIAELFAELERENDTVVSENKLELPLSASQLMTLASEAHEVYFGGRAGCGKTYLLLRAACTQHKKAMIYRKEYSQLDDIVNKSREMLGMTGAKFNGSTFVWRDIPGDRQLKFGACKHDADIDKFRGREYDFIGFDEIATFQEDHYIALTAWLRTTDPNQRVRILAAGNPPLTSNYYWVKRHWGAWLDPKHPNPAKPGEIRWYARLDDEDVEVENGEPIDHKGETIVPLSRTFVPGQMLDVLKGTSYEANLQRMPEPLRSQLLHGDFSVAEDDQERQVIPTVWVRLAQHRWEQMQKPDAPLRAVGVDVARGGKDQTIISKRYNNWFAPLLKYAASQTKTGPEVAALIQENITDDEKQAPIAIDLAGIGSSPYDILVSQNFNVDGFLGAAKSAYTDAAGQLNLVNRRAEAWWKFREALDPDSGEDIALPPDSELFADLTSPTWDLTTRGIQIEKKEDVIKRLGRSPDCGDAVVMNYNMDTRMAYF